VYFSRSYKQGIDDETDLLSTHHLGSQHLAGVEANNYGPESNDLALQLRKRGIDKVILAGMSANLCVESHLRELLEQGFEVAVVRDATAAAQTPDIDGYAEPSINSSLAVTTASRSFWTRVIDGPSKSPTCRCRISPTTSYFDTLAGFTGTSANVQRRGVVRARSLAGYVVNQAPHLTLEQLGVEVVSRAAGKATTPGKWLPVRNCRIWLRRSKAASD
jgi:hypothetical protein